MLVIDDAAKEYLHSLEQRGTDLWATEHETREETTNRYRRVWSRPPVAPSRRDAVHRSGPLLAETDRHAGHADILREQLDGEVEMDAEGMAGRGRDAAFREDRRAGIERAAKAASSR